MESQPQNSEFRNNPEYFHPCIYLYSADSLLFITLYFGSLGMDCFISESCYRGTLYDGIIGKWPFHGYFPIIPL